YGPTAENFSGRAGAHVRLALAEGEVIGPANQRRLFRDGGGAVSLVEDYGPVTELRIVDGSTQPAEVAAVGVIGNQGQAIRKVFVELNIAVPVVGGADGVFDLCDIIELRERPARVVGSRHSPEFRRNLIQIVVVYRQAAAERALSRDLENHTPA